MVRPLAPPLPAPSPPGGYRVRTVRGDEDLERRVAVHRAAFAPSRVVPESYARLMREPPYRPDLDFVAEAADGSFASFCICWLDAGNRLGEFEPVGTHPDHRRRGLAAAVCRFAHQRLREEGATRAIVYSIAGSDATTLYESIGMREHSRSIGLVKRGGRLEAR
jgi:ribosomal protein S18 acetylase RimI-like enzyme